MKEEERKLWTERINDYKSSGLTAVKWAEENNLSVHKLRYHIHKFNKEKKQASNEESKEIKWASIVPEKLEVQKVPTRPLIVTIGKATIEVGPNFDEDTLESIVRILSKC